MRALQVRGHARHRLLSVFAAGEGGGNGAGAAWDARVTDCRAQGLLEGMNQFLRQMEITFRRDPENYRPRINKMDRCCVCCLRRVRVRSRLSRSIKDKEQKAAGTFFFWDD
jgi:hypothetical protein